MRFALGLGNREIGCAACGRGRGNKAPTRKVLIHRANSSSFEGRRWRRKRRDFAGKFLRTEGILERMTSEAGHGGLEAAGIAFSGPHGLSTDSCASWLNDCRGHLPFEPLCELSDQLLEEGASAEVHRLLGALEELAPMGARPLMLATHATGRGLAAAVAGRNCGRRRCARRRRARRKQRLATSALFIMPSLSADRTRAGASCSGIADSRRPTRLQAPVDGKIIARFARAPKVHVEPPAPPSGRLLDEGSRWSLIAPRSGFLSDG
jgi:hypothetical protein